MKNPLPLSCALSKLPCGTQRCPWCSLCLREAQSSIACHRGAAPSFKGLLFHKSIPEQWKTSVMIHSFTPNSFLVKALFRRKPISQKLDLRAHSSPLQQKSGRSLWRKKGKEFNTKRQCRKPNSWWQQLKCSNDGSFTLPETNNFWFLPQILVSNSCNFLARGTDVLSELLSLENK